MTYRAPDKHISPNGLTRHSIEGYAMPKKVGDQCHVFFIVRNTSSSSQILLAFKFERPIHWGRSYLRSSNLDGKHQWLTVFAPDKNFELNHPKTNFKHQLQTSLDLYRLEQGHHFFKGNRNSSFLKRVVSTLRFVIFPFPTHPKDFASNWKRVTWTSASCHISTGSAALASISGMNDWNKVKRWNLKVL